jgi:hypothetical protein
VLRRCLDKQVLAAAKSRKYYIKAAGHNRSLKMKTAANDRLLASLDTEDNLAA